MINFITISRVFLLLPLAWVMLAGPRESWAAFWIFIVAGATDFLDGWLARKFNKTSAFGAMLDQICDKIFIAGALVLLVAKGSQILTVTPVLLIIAREFFVSGLREYAAQQGRAIPVDKFGKIKTMLQFVAIACWLCPMMRVEAIYPAAIGISLDAIRIFAFFGLWLAAILGWISAVRYFNAK